MSLNEGILTPSETGEKKEIMSISDYREVCREIVAKTEGRDFVEEDALALVEARYQLLSKIKTGEIRDPFGTSPVEKWAPTLVEDTKATLEGKGWNAHSRNALYIALQAGGVFSDETPAIKYLTELWKKAEETE